MSAQFALLISRLCSRHQCLGWLSTLCHFPWRPSCPTGLYDLPCYIFSILLSCYIIFFFCSSQAVYNEDSSLMYQPGFAYNPYPSMMLEGQIPFSPAYYPQFGMHFSHSEFGVGNDPTSAYMIPFGGYGGGNLSGNQGANSLTYPQAMGILGPYDHDASQVIITLSICLFC